MPESFNQVGYETPYLPMNLGSLFAIFVIQIALAPFIVLFARICPRNKWLKVQEKSQKAVESMPNTFLATIDGTF